MKPNEIKQITAEKKHLFSSVIDELFEKPADTLQQAEKRLITEVIAHLDSGNLRVVDKASGSWEVLSWVKKAILLYFRINDNVLIEGAPGTASYWFDKVPNKFENFNAEDFQAAKVRTVPLSFIRYGSYIAPNVIIMPSFVNIGAYVDSGTMVDSWATVGSCAQVGVNCHISAGACLGGVLEPLQASPVIIEDNCFIGSGAQVVEGVIVESGSVIAAGCTLTASTKIVDRASGDITYGKVPAGSVVVPGSLPVGEFVSVNCCVILKRVDEKTRKKTSINELLRF